MTGILRSLLDGLASIASWGETDAMRARHLAGLDDPRPGHVKDAEALRGDWEKVMGDRRVAREKMRERKRAP